jgi:hypothetical protein
MPRRHSPWLQETKIKEKGACSIVFTLVERACVSNGEEERDEVLPFTLALLQSAGSQSDESWGSTEMAMLSSQHPLMEVEERLVGAAVGGEGRALAVVWEEMGDGDKR